jgi:hypothetical protein
MSAMMTTLRFPSITAFRRLLLPIVSLTFYSAAFAQFVHPGGLHNQADLDRMKTQVAAGAHPWIDGWNLLIADPLAQSTYTAAPQANLGSNRQRASQDAHAAYLNAIRGYIWNFTEDGGMTRRELTG